MISTHKQNPRTNGMSLFILAGFTEKQAFDHFLRKAKSDETDQT